MKRVISFILAQLIIISLIPLFSFGVFAATWTAPSLVLRTSIDASGSTITATVSIDDYAGLGALNFRLTYDDTKVTYQNHTPSGILTEDDVMTPVSNYISVVWSTGNPTGDSGSTADILAVTFSVKDGQSGTAVFALTEISLNDYTTFNETNPEPVSSSVIIPEVITDINVSIPAPVKSNTPVTSVSGTGWTGTVEWEPAIFSKFVGGTIYTANVTLTPAVHYKFDDDPTVNLNGSPITPSENTSTRIVFSKTYPKTADEDLAISDQTLGGSLTVGEPYSAAIVTTGGTGAKTFGITAGSLPAGLTLNTGTGVISGTPEAYKNSVTVITVKVKDTVNTLGVSAQITIPSIGKADTDFVAPPDITAVYGQTLAQVYLPEHYSWDDESLSVGNVGTNYFPATYNDDPGNKEDAFGNIYVTVSAKPLTVSGASANNRKYNESKTIALSAVALSGIAAGDTAADVSVDTALASGTLPSANAGAYTTADLSGLVLKGAKAGNYTLAATADDVAVSVTITKANEPDIAVQQLYFTRTKATSDNTFDVAELLPSDRGTTTYEADSDGTYTWHISLDGGTVEFDTKTSSAPVSETISVTAEMRNYQTVTVEIKVNLIDQTVPAGTVTVTGTMTYGQKLSALTITAAMKDGTTVIPGAVAWDYPNMLPPAGASQQPWTFTPQDSVTYSVIKGNAAITVAKAVPLIMLSDKTAEHTGSAVEIGKPAVILVNSETYTGSISYKYYTDLALTKPTSAAQGAAASGGAPKNTGTYYVKAFISAFTNYTEAESNTAVLKITESDDRFTVTASAGNGGTVAPKQTFASAGGEVTIQVMPDDGYVVSDVKVNGVSVGAVIKYKITDIQKDYTVTAEFMRENGAPSGPFAFTDVRRSDWFYDSVKFVFDEKLMQGISSVKFDPQGVMTRAMLVTVLWRMEGSPDVRANASFPDVPSGQWYSDAVLWAAQNGIVYGYAGGAFGPADHVTREQMMTIFYRYSDYKGYDMTAEDDLAGFTDAGDISEWALEAMRWAVGMDLIQGMTPTAVAPLGFATRAQTAAILERFFG